MALCFKPVVLGLSLVSSLLTEVDISEYAETHYQGWLKRIPEGCASESRPIESCLLWASNSWGVFLASTAIQQDGDVTGAWAR